MGKKCTRECADKHGSTGPLLALLDLAYTGDMYVLTVVQLGYTVYSTGPCVHNTDFQICSSGGEGVRKCSG